MSYLSGINTATTTLSTWKFLTTLMSSLVHHERKIEFSYFKKMNEYIYIYIYFVFELDNSRSGSRTICFGVLRNKIATEQKDLVNLTTNDRWMKNRACLRSFSSFCFKLVCHTKTHTDFVKFKEKAITKFSVRFPRQRLNLPQSLNLSNSRIIVE